MGPELFSAQTKAARAYDAVARKHEIDVSKLNFPWLEFPTNTRQRTVVEHDMQDMPQLNMVSYLLDCD